MFDELITRVEAGEVSAELEREACAALGYSSPNERHQLPPYILRSLDAAYALKEAVLPGWKTEHRDTETGTSWAVWNDLWQRRRLGEAPTHAAALVAAILRAWEKKT